MADTINVQELGQSVVADNIKATAGQPANLANMALANALANQQAMNELMRANTARALNSIYISPMEGAVATTEYKAGRLPETQVGTSSGLAQAMVALGTAISALEEQVKLIKVETPGVGT